MVLKYAFTINVLVLHITFLYDFVVIKAAFTALGIRRSVYCDLQKIMSVFPRSTTTQVRRSRFLRSVRSFMFMTLVTLPALILSMDFTLVSQFVFCYVLQFLLARCNEKIIYVHFLVSTNIICIYFISFSISYKRLI